MIAQLMQNQGMVQKTLPRIRTDLQFFVRSEGSMIYDPLVHRYLRVDPISLGILKSLLSCNQSKASTAEDLRLASEQLTATTLSPELVEEVIQTAARNGLLETKPGDGWKATSDASARQQQSGWKWVLHNYISLRLSLLRPEPMLDRLHGFLSAVFSPVTAVIIATLGLVSLYLVSRQWTEFSTAVRGLSEAHMLLGLGLTILVVKLWHETGHGHFARRYGCRVPSAGILLILGTPLFYTDVTDAWRLSDRRQRMMIAGAGVMAEAILAVVAIFLWVFLKDGLARNIAFFVASGSLITTVLINLSPFMRFDGYFLLSDWLRIPNLHDRAFEAMKWNLRRSLLGFQDPLPQQLRGLNVAALTAFGAATALYRLTLFLGIAFFVYHAFFKIAGLFLFAIEIAWFILMPLKKELLVWRERKKDIQWHGAGSRTALIGIAGLLLFFAPISNSVSMKAVLEPSETARAHPVTAAVIEQVHVRQGDRVNKGDILFSLSSSQHTHQKAILDMRLALVQARIARSAADQSERGLLPVLAEEERSLIAQREGLLAEIAALLVKAPISGLVLEIDREIHPGRTVAVKDRLVLIGSEHGLLARAFAGSESLERLQPSAKAVFLAENIRFEKQHLNLMRISAAPSSNVEPSALVANFGGDVPSSPDKNGRNVASIAAYGLVFNSEASPPPMAIRGTLHVAAASESLGLRALKRAVSVIVRESGV